MTPAHALNPIAQTAYAALGRAFNTNHNDEIPGRGPSWVCDRYGKTNHNAAWCIDCLINFKSEGATK